MNDVGYTMVDRWMHNYVEYNYGGPDGVPDGVSLATMYQTASTEVDAILERVPTLDAEQGSLLMDVGWNFAWHIHDPHDYDEISALVEFARKFKVVKR